MQREHNKFMSADPDMDVIRKEVGISSNLNRLVMQSWTAIKILKIIPGYQL